MGSLEEIEKDLQNILKEQKHSDDISSYNAALVFIAGIVILSLLILFIMVGYNTKMLLVVVVILCLFTWHRMRMYRVAEHLEQCDSAIKQSSESDDKPKILKLKLEYLLSGLNLKKTRIQSVKRFYIVLFPFFLLNIREFIIGPATTTFMLWSFVITFIISAIVWNAFFSKDLKELERLSIITRQLIKEVQVA